MATECPICLSEATLIRTSDSNKPESMEDTTCQHQCCQSCLQTWVHHKIGQNTLYIQCPFVACQAIVSIYDIMRIAPDMVSAYRTLCEIYVDLPLLINEASSEKPTQCPSCHQIIFRNGGCEIIYCICGIPFCHSCKKRYAE